MILALLCCLVKTQPKSLASDQSWQCCHGGHLLPLLLVVVVVFFFFYVFLMRPIYRLSAVVGLSVKEMREKKKREEVKRMK